MTTGVPIESLVLDGDTRQALVLVRELGRAGLGVGALDVDRHAPALASRWCTARVLAPGVEQQDAYVDAVLGACAEHQPGSLLLAHDGSIEAVRRRRAELEAVVGVGLAPEAALEVAVDKARTLEFAATLGLRAPRGAFVERDGEAAAAVASVGLPAVVKPTRSWAQRPGGGARRLIPSVAQTREQALAAIDDILAEGIAVAVQEWLPGAREALSFLHARGRTWARFAQRADRTFPPLGGNSVLRESIPLPEDVAPAAERLIAELGLDGYSEVEFRRDAEGRPALMEINPRLSASVEIAVRAGVPFPMLLHRWASGEELQETSGYRVGLSMRWLGGDLSWLFSVLGQRSGPDVPSRPRALSMFAADFARPLGYDYVDRGDPRPGLVAAAGLARRVGRHTRPDGEKGAQRRAAAHLARPNAPGFDAEAVVVGAGPYGLSVSAQLAGRGVRHEVFGEAMELWSRHMPVGMYLKSEGFASNLSDPGREHTLARFCSEEGIEYGDIAVPIAIDTFERYGRWFQERAVPRLRGERVERASKVPGGFDVQLSGGESLRCKHLVVASGMTSCAYVPPPLRELRSPELVHSYEHRDPAQMRGLDVAVIGLGQSALEAAALMHEHGANVTVLARAGRVQWNSKPAPQSLRERWRSPRSGLGDARGLWAYANLPLGFHRATLHQKRKRAYKALGPAGAWWLKDRIVGKFELLLERSLLEAGNGDDRVRLALEGPDGAEERYFEQVLAGTGYTPDVTRLGFLAPLHEAIATFPDSPSTPMLDSRFQSSVEGLYLVGYLAALSFGPVMRFVYGAEFAANRVAGAVVR
jgi:predicted ATP-grasp superfamily ATP-dependent carboligase/thioredoxin reductase